MPRLFATACHHWRSATPTDLARLANQTLDGGVEALVRYLHDCNAREVNCVSDALERSRNSTLL